MSCSIARNQPRHVSGSGIKDLALAIGFPVPGFPVDEMRDSGEPKVKCPKFRLGGDSQALANQLLALIFTQATPNAVRLAIG